MNKALVTLLAIVLCTMQGLVVHANPTRQSPGATVIKKYCIECHSGDKIFKADDVDNMKSTGVLSPGNSAKSRIWLRLSSTSNPMPPMGSPQPSADDKKAVREWIDALGAPTTDKVDPSPVKPTARKWIKDSELISVIVADLQASNERELPFIRYFSLANLYRNSAVLDADLARYRTALDKLLNSLSWNPTLIKTKTLGPGGVLLRLDVRNLRWERDAWDAVIREYPYGFRPKDGGKNADLIHTLSGAAVPFVRVDWFVANASRPPLYNHLLQLPTTASGLEQKLGVDVARDIEQENDIFRGGMTNSNVSNNNRVVQRHTSNYGAYYKSFDFKDNEGFHDIFKYPLDFKSDGGEYIFHLPNKLYGYMITDGAGKRIDSAPVEVVFDKATPNSNGIITNGLSCIGCHASGIKEFSDDVRKSLQKLNKSTTFDLDKALAIYSESAAMNAKVREDNVAYKNSLSSIGIGGEYLTPSVEPVITIARYYLSNGAAVTTAQAAADVGVTVADFQKGISRSTVLQQLGLTRLEDDDGAIKRDTWEKAFPEVIHELGVGSMSRRGGPPAHPDVKQEESLDVSVDRGPGGVYKLDEHVGISVKPGFDGFLYVYSIDSNGHGALLFPSSNYSAAPDGKVSGGKSIDFGLVNSFLPIKVNEVSGDELVIAILSQQQLTDLPGVSSLAGSKGLVPVTVTQSSMRDKFTAKVRQEKSAGHMAVMADVRLRTVK
jgi:hypothetical protein